MNITKIPLANRIKFILANQFLVFLVWSFWLASPYLIFGDASFVKIHDNADSTLSMYLAAEEHGLRANVGDWNPQYACGVDRTSSRIFPALTQVPFALLPGWLAYGVILWGQRFIAGFFTSLLLRERLALGLLPAMFGGMFYSCFFQAGVDVQGEGFNLFSYFGTPSIPAFLWALGRLDDPRGKMASLIALALGVLLSVASSFHTAMLFFPVFLVWFLLIEPRRTVRFWLRFAMFVVTWSIAIQPEFWALALNASHSHRSDRTSSGQLPSSQPGFWIRQAQQLFSDNLVPIVMGLVGLLVGGRRDRRLVVPMALILSLLAFLLGYHWFRRHLLDEIGFLSGFPAHRLIFIVPFLCSVAAAAALPHLLGPLRVGVSWGRRPLVRVAFPVLAAIGAILFITWQSVQVNKQLVRTTVDGSNFAALYRHPDLEWLARSTSGEPPFRVATVTPYWDFMCIHPAVLGAYGFDAADGYLSLYPNRYQDFWGRVLAPLLSTDHTIAAYYKEWGSRIYLFGPSGGFPDTEPVRPSDYYNLDLLSLANVRYIVSPQQLADDRLRLVSSQVATASPLEAVKVSRRRKLLQLLRGEVSWQPLYIYENRDFLPRFFLVGQAQVFDDPEKLLEALASAAPEELRSTAFVARQDVPPDQVNLLDGTGGTLTCQSLADDRIVLDVDADGPSLLVVSQNWNRFWHARVDGSERPIIPVDHAFQGLFVPGGSHKVVLTYDPTYSFRRGPGDIDE
jgi:hypothetical protein